jgi:hypothetical protein
MSGQVPGTTRRCTIRAARFAVVPMVSAGVGPTRQPVPEVPKEGPWDDLI